MKILGIDTSTSVASVALVEDSRILGESTYNLKKTHSEKLMPMIDRLLGLLEMEPAQIEGFAVAVGPGSFTGLRIGLATAKGLSYSLEKPLLGINTLDGLAFNAKGTAPLICPLISARRGECYLAVYDGDAIPLTDYQVLDVQGLKALFDERGWKAPLFLGDGAKVYSEQLAGFFPGHKLAAPGTILNRGSSVALLAAEMFRQGCADNIYTMEPYYIRASGAERRRGQKLKGEKNP